MEAKTLADIEREEANQAAPTPIPSTPSVQPQPEPEPLDVGPIKRDAALEQGTLKPFTQITTTEDVATPPKDPKDPKDPKGCKGCDFEHKTMPYIRVATAGVFALFIVALIYVLVTRAKNLPLPA